MNKRPAAYNQRVARIQAFDDIEHQIRDIINNDQSTRSKIQQEFDGTDKSARDAYRAAVANNQAACKELGARNRRTAENLVRLSVRALLMSSCILISREVGPRADSLILVANRYSQN